MEDKNIISLFFERSEAAITALSEKYGKLLNKVAMNVLNNQADAEECVNDTYLGVWNTIPPKNPESLIAYVCRIARNQALKKYEFNTAEKRNSYYDAVLDEIEEIVASGNSVEEESEGERLTEALDEYFGSLAETDRIVFMRRYYFSDSYSSIAALTGISEKNVSVRLVRIRKALREYLKERGFVL